MAKIIKLNFNELGVLVSTAIDPIRQGDSGVEIRATFENKNNVNYTALFTLTRPDGQVIKGGLNPDSQVATDYTKVLDSAYYFEVDGATSLTIFLYSGSQQVLAQGQTTIAVEKTDFDEKTDIDVDTFTLLMSYIAQKLDKNKSFIVTDYVASLGDLSEYENGQNFYAYQESKFYVMENGALVEKHNLNSFLKTTGGSMTGDLNLQGHKLRLFVSVIGSADLQGYAEGQNSKVKLTLPVMYTQDGRVVQDTIDFTFQTGGEYGFLYSEKPLFLGNLQHPIYDIRAMRINGLSATDLEHQANKTNEITGSSTLKYTSEKAVYDYVKNEISKLGVHKLTKTAEGANFETEDELNEQGRVFYYHGQPHTPDENDYAIVNKYGTDPDNLQPARFSFDGRTWSFDYLLNNLTVEQQKALNSGISAEKVAGYDAYDERIETNTETIANLADLVNVIKLYVGTKELADGTEIPDLSDIRQIEPIQKTYSFEDIYDAISNKKHVKIVATYSDSSRYIHGISNVSEISITLTLKEGIVVDYFDFAGEISEIVHKIGEGGGTGAVDSVNGQTGTVVLTAEDIALESEDKTVEEKLIEQDSKIEGAIETAEGKAKSIVLSYTWLFTDLGHGQATLIDALTGDDITSQIGTGDYVDENVINSVFNSTETTLEVIGGGETKYIIFQDKSIEQAPVGYYKFKLISVADFYKVFNLGDIVNIVEEAPFDRWVSYAGSATIAFSKYTTVDPSKFVQKTDIATSQVAGIIKLANGVKTLPDGLIYADTYTKQVYDTSSEHTFVGKGTLDNVLDEYRNDVAIYDKSEIDFDNLTDKQYNDFLTKIVIVKSNSSFTFGFSPVFNTVKIIFFPSAVSSNQARSFALIGNGVSPDAPVAFIRTILYGTDRRVRHYGSGYIQWDNISLTLFNVGKINDKVIPAYPSNTGTFTFKQVNGALSWLDESTVSISTATYNGAILSSKDYKWTVPATSITIASCETQTGDLQPMWSLTFEAGENCSLTLPEGAKWVGGTAPTFTSGKIYTVVIKTLGTNLLAVSGEF